MIIKQYLPFRFSREGYIPDRIHLQTCLRDAEKCGEFLKQNRKTVHYHLSEDGSVTALTPLSAAANLLGPTGRDPAPSSEEIPAARRGILILAEAKDGKLSEEQKNSLIRLIKNIQREFLRIYGEPFDLCRRSLRLPPDLLSEEELLEEAYCPVQDTPRFRVQTGSYLHRRDAEEKIEQLTAAGIAAYITEVREA